MTLSCRQLLDIQDAEPLPDEASAVAGGGAGSSAPLTSGGEAGEAAPNPAGGQGGETAGLCEQYCDEVLDGCTGAFAVYTSRETCLTVCAALPEGAPADVSGNTVHCRLHAARSARAEVAHYCPAAGPGGNGVCGRNCEGLCRLRAGICAPFVASDEAACRTDCETLPDLGRYSTDVTQAQYAGPHVQCRLYHVSAAPLADTDQHCAHVDGAAPCK